MQNRPKLLWTFRVLAFMALFGWASYLALTFRATDVGAQWPGLVVMACIFAGLPASAVFLGLPLRRYCAVLAALVVLPVVLAEGYATLEERLFLLSVRDLPPTAPVVFKDRWWPNGISYLYYKPATGQLGGGD